MASVRFNLEKPSTQAKTMIYLIYCINKNNRLKWYFKQKINPKNWNTKTQRALNSHPGHATLNLLLSNITAEVEDHIRMGMIRGSLPSAYELKTHLNERFLNVEAAQLDFYSFIDMLIAQRLDSPKFKNDSIKVYKSARIRLYDYDPKLSFEKITLDWFYDFTSYLYKLKYSTNYIQRIIKTLKLFLNEAGEKGINKNHAYKSKRFNIAEKEVDHIYLNEKELELIYKKKFILEGHQNAANLFLIGAYTGLRYSDYISVNIERDMMELDGVPMLKIRTKKTGEVVAIPIHPILKDVLENRQWHYISNQRLNIYLKEIGHLVKINDYFYKTSYVGEKEVIKRFLKYEMMTTHTARRSFATNAFISGVPVQNIMKITGHRTEKAFYKYIKITKEQNAVLMSKSAFFQGGLRKVN